METMNAQYVIAGCGPGSKRYVTVAVEEAVAQAKVLAGAPRLLELFTDSTAQIVPLAGPVDAWLDKLAEFSEGPVVVLVSGDTGLCSFATRLQQRFGRGNCSVIAGISSVQVACARLGLSWENAQIVSAHAALPTELPNEWAARDPIVFLMGARGAETFVAEFAETEQRHCIVCEDVTLPTERVALTLPQALKTLPSHPRRLVVLTRESCYES